MSSKQLGLLPYVIACAMRLQQKTVLEYPVSRTSLCIVIVTMWAHASRVLLRWRHASVFVHATLCFSRLDSVLWRLGYMRNDLDVLCIIDIATTRGVHVFM